MTAETEKVLYEEAQNLVVLDMATRHVSVKRHDGHPVTTAVAIVCYQHALETADTAVSLLEQVSQLKQAEVDTLRETVRQLTEK